MFPRLFRGVAPLFLILGSAASAQSDPPVTPADLRRHIDVLASDAFEGRAPGTAGETLEGVGLRSALFRQEGALTVYLLTRAGVAYIVAGGLTDAQIEAVTRAVAG